MNSQMMEQQFHAPDQADTVDRLVSQRNYALARMAELADFVLGDQYADACAYFFSACEDRFTRYTREVKEIFNLEAATAYLDAVFWKRALSDTGLWDSLPQKREDEWQDVIEKRKCPAFDESAVRETLADLALNQKRFAAEKADGVFRRLSREHVTNVPEGFGKRFILNYCFSYGSASHSSAGYLNDLRELCAKLMRRDMPNTSLSMSVMNYARNERRGEWVNLDGGAIRIRCYLKGTMHVECHPQLAWRLNQLLHELHPMAIPSRFRHAPKQSRKLPDVHDRPLSFACLETLRRGGIRDGKWVSGYDTNKAALKEAESVLEQIGAVKLDGNWQFDYDPTEALREIQCTGVVPDKVSHQFYPTPPEIIEAMLEEADIKPHHACLEPSAGTGAIADKLPDPTCIEISPLHCKVLELKFHSAIEADFIGWAGEQDTAAGSYDRVVMNPPYSEGRAMAHLEAARPLLAEDGRIVALLPATYQNRGLPGRWARTFDRFPGTNISVAIYVEDKE